MELTGGGEGGGLGGGGLGASTFVASMEITLTTEMRRMALAASGVSKLLPSAFITRATCTPASRVIEAVMRTLAASTVMATASELTLASSAMKICRLEVLE